MVNLFSLNTSLGIPIYRQLIDQTKQAIRLNILKQGDQLPSVRSIASSLQINPMTISKAYAQLELEGVLERKRGIGMLVAKSDNQQTIAPEIEKALDKFIGISRGVGLSDETIQILVQQALSLHVKEREL